MSRDILRTVIGGGLILVAILASLAIGFFIKESHQLRAERLERENTLLEQEVEGIQKQLATLEGWMNDLAERDQQYRIIAGLEPLDEEVHQAGIGGPGTKTVQSNPLWRLNPRLGERTFSTAYDLNTLLRRAHLLSRSWGQATDTLEKTHERWAKLPSIQPTRGYVSSGFSHSRWHPILHRPRPHEGIDISAATGTPILATARGTVTWAGRRGQYGRMVEIDHGHGIVTRYAHASRVVARRGQRIERGEKIAEVGESGLAAGPHLHYEVLRDGRPVNPSQFIIDAEAIPD